MKIEMDGVISSITPHSGIPSMMVNVQLTAVQSGGSSEPRAWQAHVSIRMPKDEAEKLRYGQQMHLVISSDSTPEDT